MFSVMEKDISNTDGLQGLEQGQATPLRGSGETWLGFLILNTKTYL